MKKFIGVFLLVLITVFSYAQKINQKNVPAVVLNAYKVKFPTAYDIDVIAPQYLENENSLTIQSEYRSSFEKYLVENIVYPENASSCRIQGTEVVKFTVTEIGNVSDFKIVNCVCPEIDNEVIRVLKTTSGKWNPGLKNGEPVAMEKEISVAFILSPKNKFVKKAKQYLHRGNKLMYVKNNPKKALTFYNRAINLLPNEESLLTARVLYKVQIGDQDGALDNWNRLILLAERNGQNVGLEKYADINKTAEMKYALKK